MTNADIVLLLLIAGAFLVGFFWGVIRGLLALAAWVVVFVVAAYLATPLGDYLSGQWSQFGVKFNHTLGFGIAAAVLYVVVLVLIQFTTRGAQDVSRFPVLDDLVGGFLGVLIAVLVFAGTIMVLRTAYGPAATVGPGLGPAWMADLYRALVDSTIGSRINEGLVPGLNSILGPLLPPDIRQSL